MVTGPISALVASVRDGTTTATELAEAALDAAERSQPVLNGFTLIDRDGAMRRAQAVDRLVASGGDPGPLAGVPVALKDLIDQAGLPNTAGASFEPAVPTADAPVVELLHDAGALIVGRTGLHEFAFGFTSENAHFGPVRNPWHTDLSPGGSSGGSGAVVAAGVVPMAVGTDTGGSVRVPAALCGVLGLKVTYGAISLDGVVPLAPSLDTVGPIARSVDDLAAAYRALAPDDHKSLQARTVASLRIAVPRQWLGWPMDFDISAAFTAALEAVAASGGVVEERDVPALGVPPFVTEAAMAEIAGVHRVRWNEGRHRYGPDVAERLEGAMAARPETIAMAREWAIQAGAAAAELLADFDAIATPTVGATRKTIGVDTIEVDGSAHQHRVLLAAWTSPVNRLGLPALALPLPATTTPPPSLQLVGPSGGEWSLLEVGAALEAAGIVAVAPPPAWFA